jgi:pimeloyl-ACP methyl ester carboxylesterase
MPYLELSEDFRPYYEIHDYTDPWERAETIMFVHGFTENTTAWRAWIPLLSRKYRLLMFDIRGFGKTGAVDKTFKYSTDLFADDMVRIINHLVGDAVHIISGKSGGISTMHLAATRPDLVKSIILTCPPLVAPGSANWLAEMQAHGMRDWARNTMAPRLGYDAHPRSVDWWVDMMGATSLSTAEAYLNWVPTTEPRAELDKINVPALFILTELSQKNNSTAGQVQPDVVSKGMPHAKIEILKLDCYHPAASAPEICAALAEKFLATLR